MLLFFFHALVVLALSWALLAIARHWAQKIDLLDHPSERKTHARPVPLAGGLAIVPVLSIISAAYLPGWQETTALIAAMSIVFVMGIVDDRHELPASLRLGLQTSAALILIFFADLRIEHLGNLGGQGNIVLGPFSEFFTAVCIVTTINAFNMIDGSDGILGSLGIIALLTVALYNGLSGNTHFAMYAALCALALLPFLSANLASNSSERKVFMGDAGSMVLGLFIAYTVIHGASGADASYAPIAAVFIIAIPIYDFLRVFSTRLARGVSPFTPERNHLHHVFLGYTGRVQTLLLISAIALGISISGALLINANAADKDSMLIFLATLLVLSVSLFFLDKRNVVLRLTGDSD